MLPPVFTPKLLTVLREGYTRQKFLADLTAGVIVGIVALPLAIAFAIASGAKPEQGLYTAIIAGALVSILGGSRVQIAGPTGAFIVIVYGIIQRYGYDGLAIATMLAGVMLIVMGLAKLGTLLKFVPYPLTVGFTSGIAVIIFTSQLNDLLGLHVANLPADFAEKWAVYGEHLTSFNGNEIAVSAASLVIMLFWGRFVHRIPGSLVAIVGVTIVVKIANIPVDTIGSRFGNVVNALPSLHVPHVTWQTVTKMFSPAVAIALLGGIESLLSAVVADGMIRSRHRSNMELIAQGVANIVSPIFLGLPATGAIARTAANIKNGGRTPVAGIVHAVTLLVIMLFLGQWASLIPMATLAAVLVVVAYGMSEWRSFRQILKSPKSDIAVLLAAFLLTVFVDLTVAIEVGVVLSALLFMRRMAEVSTVQAVTDDLREDQEEQIDGAALAVPDGVEIFEVYGALFFGAVDQFTESLREFEKSPRVLILQTEHLLAIDASGLRALDTLAAQMAAQGTTLLIAGIHKQPYFAIQQSGLIDRLGEDHVCADLPSAVETAKGMMGAR